jgi:hypothetical protein
MTINVPARVSRRHIPYCASASPPTDRPDAMRDTSLKSLAGGNIQKVIMACRIAVMYEGQIMGLVKCGEVTGEQLGLIMAGLHARG